MGGPTARLSALLASLAGHAALLLALAGAGLLAGGVARQPPDPIPVGRAPDAAAPALRLVAEVGDGGAAPVDGGAAIPLDTADPLYRPYLLGVQRRIWDRWSAPSLPGDAAARGSLVVEFSLTRSGRLAAAGVREPSGVAALDRAALEAVARAEPFSPLPEAIAGEQLLIRARFIYD